MTAPVEVFGSVEEVQGYPPKLTVHEQDPDEVFKMLIPAGAEITDLYQIRDTDGRGYVGNMLGFVDEQWTVQTQETEEIHRVHWTIVDCIEWYGDR